MRLILIRILPIAAVLGVTMLLVFRQRPAPGKPSPSPEVPKTQKPRKTSSGNVAAIARKRSTAGSLRRERGPQPEPSTENEVSIPETGLAQSNPSGPDWASFLQRHAEGDEAAFPELLNALTPENALTALEAVRSTKLSPADRAGFYGTLGKIGGGDMIQQLMNASDPHATLAVSGWGQADPAGALDWFRQIDIRGDEELQRYLSASHQSMEGFLDQVSDKLLNSLHPAPDNTATETTREAYSAETLQFVESLMEQDPRKAEAVMRELTERLIQLYDGSTLADWVTQMENPVIKSSAIQRIIEAGTFENAPMEAVDWAFLQEEGKGRENAISAAFGKLGSGAGGIDPAEIANQLNEMPEGRDRDFAINGFAHGLVGSAPEDALAWAAAITDEGFRNVVTENVTRRIEAQAAGDGN